MRVPLSIGRATRATIVRRAMAENCTIYCKVLDRDEVARLLQTHFPPSHSTCAAGNPTLVHGNEGNLRLTQKVFRGRGDDFSRLLVSTCVFVEGLANADVAVKTRLVSHIESCELILGVVAKPTFDADERYHAVVIAIAKALCGIVFNGREILDADGQTIVAVP